MILAVPPFAPRLTAGVIVGASGGGSVVALGSTVGGGGAVGLGASVGMAVDDGAVVAVGGGGAVVGEGGGGMAVVAALSVPTGNAPGADVGTGVGATT